MEIEIKIRNYLKDGSFALFKTQNRSPLVTTIPFEPILSVAMINQRNSVSIFSLFSRALELLSIFSAFVYFEINELFTIFWARQNCTF